MLLQDNQLASRLAAALIEKPLSPSSSLATKAVKSANDMKQ
jgi:hypothetical protein